MTALREPTVAWAALAQRGDLRGLGWVGPASPDDPVRPEEARALPEEGAEGRFHATPTLGAVPPSIAAAGVEAVSRGQPTAWEALGLVFARAWWWVAASPHHWSAYGASLAAQAYASERYGVGLDLHGDDPQRLSRLLATLPRVYANRGTLATARALCRALGEPSDARLASALPSRQLALCRGGASWAAQPLRIADLRIQRGVLLAAPPAAQRAESLTLLAAPGPLPIRPLRLLPAWTTLTGAAPTSPDPRSAT